MDFLFLISGFILGIILTTIIFKRGNKVYGTIDVDQKTGLCRFHISSDELANRRNTKAVFDVNHDVEISHDKQSL